MAAYNMENIRKKALMPFIIQLYMIKSLQNIKMNKSYKVIFFGQNKGFTLSENYKTLVLNTQAG